MKQTSRVLVFVSHHQPFSNKSVFTNSRQIGKVQQMDNKTRRGLSSFDTPFVSLDYIKDRRVNQHVPSLENYLELLTFQTKSGWVGHRRKSFRYTLNRRTARWRNARVVGTPVHLRQSSALVTMMAAEKIKQSPWVGHQRGTSCHGVDYKLALLVHKSLHGLAQN